MTAILLVGLAAMAASLPVRIEGASTCPRPAEVERRLTQLLTSSAVAASAVNLGRVDPAPAGVRVSLIRADGTTVGERVLPGQASCAELAVQVAVAIAAWHGDAYPDLTPTRPTRPTRATRPSRARSAPIAPVVAATRAPASPAPRVAASSHIRRRRGSRGQRFGILGTGAGGGRLLDARVVAGSASGPWRSGRRSDPRLWARERFGGPAVARVRAGITARG